MSFNIETSIGFLIAKTHQSMHARFRDLLAPHGLTPQQFALLAFLWKEDLLSQAELSEKTGIDRTTLSGLIDRLEKQQLVVRQPHPDDRRACQIALTMAGRAMKPVLMPRVKKLRQCIDAKFSEQEYQQICQFLERLRGVFDE